MAVVVCIWFAVRHPGLTHHEDVVAEPEGIWVHRHGAEVDIGVVAWRLTC